MLALDALVNLFAMHGNVLRCVDTDAHLFPLTPRTVMVTSSPTMTVSPTRRVRISIFLFLWLYGFGDCHSLGYPENEITPRKENNLRHLQTFFCEIASVLRSKSPQRKEPRHPERAAV